MTDHTQGERAAAARATAALIARADQAGAALRDRAAGNRERLTTAAATMAAARPGYWLPLRVLRDLAADPGPVELAAVDPGPGVTGRSPTRARVRVGPVPAAGGVPADREAFGRLLASSRAAAGLSQATLARLAGVDRRHVERLEAGTRRATPVMAAVLADVIHPADAGAARDLAARLAMLSTVPPEGQTYAGMGRVIRRAIAAARAELRRRRQVDGPPHRIEP